MTLEVEGAEPRQGLGDVGGLAGKGEAEEVPTVDRVEVDPGGEGDAGLR